MKEERSAEFTEKWAKTILEKYVGTVTLKPLLVRGGVDPALDATCKFPIYIDTIAIDVEEQKVTLMHEVLHIFYILKMIDVSEETVEDGAITFCDGHRDFVDQAWENVMRAHCTVDMDEDDGYIFEKIYSEIKFSNCTWPVQTSFCFMGEGDAQ